MPTDNGGSHDADRRVNEALKEAFDDERERAWWAGRLRGAGEAGADRSRWQQVSLPRASAAARKRRGGRFLGVGAAAALMVVAAAAVLHARQPTPGPAARVQYHATLAGLSALVSHQVWKQYPGAQLLKVVIAQAAPGPMRGVPQVATWFEGEYRLGPLVWWEQVRIHFLPPSPPRLLGPLHPYAYPGRVVPPHPIGAAFFAGKATSSIAIPPTDLARLVALLNQAHPLPAGIGECQGAHSSGIGPLTLLFSYRNQPQTGVYIAGSCAWFKPYAFAASGITISSRHSRFVRFLYSANWYRMPAGIAAIIRQAEQQP